MKLFQLHEQRSMEQTPFGEWLKDQVEYRVMKGESRLKKLLEKTNFTMDHVRYAMINGECLRDPEPGEPSLGPTYFEQTLSNVLRDLINKRILPPDKLNDARAYFGLERLGLKKKQKVGLA